MGCRHQYLQLAAESRDRRLLTKAVPFLRLEAAVESSHCNFFVVQYHSPVYFYVDRRSSCLAICKRAISELQPRNIDGCEISLAVVVSEFLRYVRSVICTVVPMLPVGQNASLIYTSERIAVVSISIRERDGGIVDIGVEDPDYLACLFCAAKLSTLCQLCFGLAPPNGTSVSSTVSDS